MDTEKMFLSDDLDNEILIQELDGESLLIARKHVELTRHLQEIHQLCFNV